MFHHDSWKSIYFKVKGSKVKVTKHKNIAGMVCSAKNHTGNVFVLRDRDL